jgi:hypothetical protein
MNEDVNIALLAKVCQDALADTNAIRRQLADVQSLAARIIEVLRNAEHRNEARLAMIDARFATIDTRLAAIDTRFAALDSWLRGIGQRMGDHNSELVLTITSEVMIALGKMETRLVGLIEERLPPRLH